MIKVFDLDQAIPLLVQAEVGLGAYQGGMCNASWHCTPEVGDNEWMMYARPSSRIRDFDARSGSKTIIKAIMELSKIIQGAAVRHSHDKSVKASCEIDRPGGKTGHRLDVMRK